MIEVELRVFITAAGDDDADQVIAELREAGRDWPYLPVVNITETSRELVR